MNVKTTSSIALAGNKFNTTNKCKLLRGKHPLKQYKFYLDIQSSQTSTKIEQLIKELGGNLEFFWTQEVTHFVTDKEIHENPSVFNGTSAPPSNNGNQSVNSNYSDGSLNSPNVTNDFNKTAKPRSHSRANAMLHKARRETNDINATQQDRFTSKAKELGTVIWHTNYTLKFLKKLIAELALLNKEKNNNSIVNNLNNSRDLVELKEPFIKIESVERSYRPFYKELLKSDFSILKIRNRKDKEKGGVGDHKKMTRKSRSSSKHRPQNHVNIKSSSKVSSSDKKSGYCELCKVEYDVLNTHLKTDEHCCFVKNHQNFLVLDTLIKNGANVNKFLNQNSKIERDLSEQYSPTKQENKISPLKSPRQLRQTATRLSKNAINQTSDNDLMNVSVASPAIEKVKTKVVCKDSPPIRHTLQSSMLYKVVDGENNKANDAAGKGNNHNFVNSTKPNKMETRNKGATDGGGGGDGPIIVKFRKIRQSELTLLNGEAVNFMFPKKRRGSTEMTDVDRQTTSDNSRLSTSSFSLTSEQDNDSSFHAQNKRRKHGAADNNINITNNKASACNKTTDDNLEDSSLIGKRTTVTTTTTRASSPPTLRKSRTSTAASTTSLRSPVSAIRTRRQCVTGIYKELDEDEILLMDELLLLEDVSQPPPIVEKSTARRRTRAKSVAPRLMKDTPELPKTPVMREEIVKKREETVKKTEEKTQPVPIPIPIPIPMVQPKIPSLLEASDKLKDSFFAFERIPSSEQWYKVFQRQDNCKQRVFEYYGNTDYRKLPYELGAQSIREPKIPCFLCPKKEGPVIKREKSPPPVVAKPHAPPKVIKSEKTAAEGKIVPKEKDSKKSSRPKPKAIFKKAWLFETPRKSPRVHASTLAILSCLLRQQENDRVISSPSPHSSPSKSNKSSPVKQLTSSSSPVKEEKTDSSSVIEPPSSPVIVMENIPVIRRESSRFKESGGSSSDTPPPIIKIRKKRQPRQDIVLTPIPQEEDTEEFRSVFQHENEINDFILNEFSSPFTCDNSFQEELDRTRTPPSAKSRKSSTSVDKDFDYSYFSSSHYSLVDLVTDSDNINFSKFYMNPRAGISRNYNVRRNNCIPGGLFMVGKKRKNNRTGWPNKKRPAANNRRCKVFTFTNRLKKIIPGLVDEATNASTVTTVSTVDSVSAEKSETPCTTPMDLEDTEFNVSSDSLDGSTTVDERPPSSIAEKRRLKVPTVRLRRFKR